MKRFLLKLLPITGMLITWSSAYAVTCNISVTSLNTIFLPTTASFVNGTVSGNCTPTIATEATVPPTIYIGMNLGARSPRSMMLLTAADLLTYSILKGSNTNGIWNEGTGRANPNQNGGLLFTMAAGTINVAQPFSYTYVLNIPVQTKPAGIYEDASVTATIRETSAAGAPLGNSVFNLTASIVKACIFSTNPSTLNLSYTSFSATAVTGTSPFAIRCTIGTGYTLALAPTTGTAQGVNYSLILDAASSTGTALAQNFIVTGTAAAGQAGTCSIGPCVSPTNLHTITVTF